MTGLPEPSLVREFAAVGREQFETDIRPAGQPAVLRGLGADWPAVDAARRGDEPFASYLLSFATERPVAAIVGEPDIAGRFFYDDRLTGFNFQRGRSKLEPFLGRLLRDRDHRQPIAMAIQSAPIAEVLPGFERDNRTALVPPGTQPRAWIGNRVRVAPHFDPFENIGVVAAGRRRFTLFPPGQIANLYPGPFDFTPAGTPVSMVDLREPDLDRHPRFALAMEQAQVAELEPGDAIYIPYQWWHGVESLAPLNLFVNYWWNEAPTDRGDPNDALLHAFLAIKHLPPDQRAAWRAMFDFYVFETDGDPAAHLPPAARGVLGEPTPDLLARIRNTLRQALAARPFPGGPA